MELTFNEGESLFISALPVVVEGKGEETCVDVVFLFEVMED